MDAFLQKNVGTLEEIERSRLSTLLKGPDATNT